MDYAQSRTGIGECCSGVAGGIPTVALNPGNRQPEIATQMNILNNSLDLLEKSLVGLQGKLSPILSANRPADPNKNGISAAQSDLAKLIQTYNNRLSNLTDLVNEIYGRVEL